MYFKQSKLILLARFILLFCLYESYTEQLDRVRGESIGNSIKYGDDDHQYYYDILSDNHNNHDHNHQQAQASSTRDLAQALAARLLINRAESGRINRFIDNNDDDDHDHVEGEHNFYRLESLDQTQQDQSRAKDENDQIDWNKFYESILSDPLEHNELQSQANNLNAHLPATNPFGLMPDQQLSPPVNEPLVDKEEEDEQDDVELGHLTSRLNSAYPNTANRTRLLLRLLESGPDDDEQSVHTENLLWSNPKMDDKFRRLMLYLYQLEAASSSTSSPSLRDQYEVGDFDSASTTLPSSRYGASEYIDHPLALAGHQYVQGGAGEGRQLLGPDGTFENVQVIKSDAAVPSYCDPPNPCPLGFTAKDGCLENFVNSASFSREYQAKQQCSCDNEHSLFNCASPPMPSKQQNAASSEANRNSPNEQQPQKEARTASSDGQLELEGNKLDTLARALQNRFGDLDAVRQLTERHQQEMGLAKSVPENDNLLVRSARKWSRPLGVLGEHEGKLPIQFD